MHSLPKLAKPAQIKLQPSSCKTVCPALQPKRSSHGEHRTLSASNIYEREKALQQQISEFHGISVENAVEIVEICGNQVENRRASPSCGDQSLLFWLGLRLVFVRLGQEFELNLAGPAGDSLLRVSRELSQRSP